MGENVLRTTRDPRTEPPCPACGRPRGTMATRHKVLGAWVPEWEARPCGNPDCPLHAGPGGTGAEAASAQVTGTNGETGRSRTGR
ncbi:MULTISPECIES: hypothetical protein [unclassified Streptomyces]|uniref:hypothetical protein n=1 Tax=unclassified Streptomyces TaxID=2593676 RepID=UPI0016612549|nr:MULTISPECIES: hypothetical protein [unclassified Streptomyces]MBD0707422.1 hypothetical protein [Streptomyces sp. CBMA291]MBD0715126.1 hypothetical protein [Streptomyces sp. CBMA370]